MTSNHKSTARTHSKFLCKNGIARFTANIPKNFSLEVEVRRILGVAFTPQSSLIGVCERSASGSPHFSPSPLVLGDNRPACLIPTQKWPIVHHLEAINHLVTFTLMLCLCPDWLTLLFIKAVCGSDVRGEPSPRDAVPRSFLPIER
ncbi:hypothetical protein TNCV_100831 [Trichonephila clavipes]|nr:hypothetical protein TNCV_100831 [Trichonephila clavipes]